LLSPHGNRVNHALYIALLPPLPHPPFLDFLQPATISSSLPVIRAEEARTNQDPVVDREVMAPEWWWFLVLNAIVAAIAVLSQVRPPPPPSPRGGGITRRASSAVLQRLRSTLFSFPSVSLHAAASAPLPQPVAAAAAPVYQETEELVASEAPPAKPVSTPRSLATPPPPAKEDDPNAMSMEEAYALVQAARRRPEPGRKEEARRSDVDAKEEEFIQGFKEDLRQQRLNSIFNYTQMLKKRALGGGRRPPANQPDQR
jgi:hypothetical protein